MSTTIVTDPTALGAIWESAIPCMRDIVDDAARIIERVGAERAGLAADLREARADNADLEQELAEALQRIATLERELPTYALMLQRYRRQLLRLERQLAGRADVGDDENPVHSVAFESPAQLRRRAVRGHIRPATLALLDSDDAAGYTMVAAADAAVVAGLLRAGLTREETLTLLVASERGQAALRCQDGRGGLAYLEDLVGSSGEIVAPTPTPTRAPAQARRYTPATRPPARRYRPISQGRAS